MNEQIMCMKMEIENFTTHFNFSMRKETEKNDKKRKKVCQSSFDLTQFSSHMKYSTWASIHVKLLFHTREHEWESNGPSEKW